MKTQLKSINISVPTTMRQRIQRLAKQENKTESEILKEAFRAYNRIYKFRKGWARISSLGEQTAQRMGIKSYDDVERIAG